MSLIDTGSEITCISENFYEAHKEAFQKCPKLPISCKVVKGATGSRASRPKLQMFLRTQIGEIAVSIIYIVVPRLVKDCIIGYDTHQAMKMLIDAGNETITISNDGKRTTLPCGVSRIKKNSEYETLVMEDDFEEDSEDEIEEEFNGHSLTPRIAGTAAENVEEFAHDGEVARGNSPFQESLNEDLTIEEIDAKLSACVNISAAHKDSLRNLLWEYREVFRKKPGLLTAYEHELKMKHEEPFFVKPYPIPMQYQERVKSAIQKMMEQGIIRRSTSPYINPVVPVIKKDKDVRLCLDARSLNDRLIDDHESPQGIETIFQKCYGVRAMTSLDLTSSFWQIPLTE